jgi:hypothetical protein
MAQKLELNPTSEETARVFAPGIQRVVTVDDPEWTARDGAPGDIVEIA